MEVGDFSVIETVVPVFSVGRFVLFSLFENVNSTACKSAIVITSNKGPDHSGPIVLTYIRKY